MVLTCDSRTAEVYDTSTGVSTQLPDMPFGRGADVGVTLPDGRCAVLGGFYVCTTGPITNCIAYNAEAGAWEELPELLAPRENFAAWVVGGCVVIAAGKWRHVPGAEVALRRGGFALVPR
jgi:hypothetical protein